MKKELSDKKDIELLVNSFYEKVKQDETIGYIFNDVAKVDWTVHLPIMYNFWEMMIFGTGPYKGDPMTKHIELNKKTPLESIHFDRWKKLFIETVDDLFQGEKAEDAKGRASHIATLMQFKVEQSK